MHGVVQLSVLPRLRQMFIMDGADNVYCSRDLCLPLSLVPASFDRTSAQTFSPIGMCWIHTRLKPDCMTLWTRW